MSAEIKGLKTIYHNTDEAFITRGYRNWCHATENFRVHEEPDCHKDYVNQLSPPEIVCYVDESFDETLICEKASNRQIFLTIFQGNFEQLMKLSAKVDPRITSWWRKSEKSTIIMIRKMKS